MSQTNFFSQIDSLLEGIDIEFKIKKINGKISIVFLPIPRIDDEAKNKIGPLSLEGTVEDLDEKFFDAIKTPLEKVSLWSISMKNFENDMAAAEAASQREKAKLDKEKKLEKEASDKKKKDQEKIKKFIDKAAELATNNLFRQAYQQIENALKIDPEHKELLKFKNEYHAKSGMPIGMFDQASESTPVINDQEETIETPADELPEDFKENLSEVLNPEQIEEVQS